MITSIYKEIDDHDLKVYLIEPQRNETRQFLVFFGSNVWHRGKNAFVG